MALGSTHARGALADINVTPMVDVMLVLLVIFMVTAPMMTQGVAVQLPTAQAQPIDTADRRSVLTLTRDRRIYLGDTEIIYTELKDKLVGNIKLRDDREVNLYADRTLDYGFVVDIMAILKDAGVESLGMVTEPAAASPRARRR